MDKTTSFSHTQIHCWAYVIFPLKEYRHSLIVLIQCMKSHQFQIRPDFARAEVLGNLASVVPASKSLVHLQLAMQRRCPAGVPDAMAVTQIC